MFKETFGSLRDIVENTVAAVCATGVILTIATGVVTFILVSLPFLVADQLRLKLL